MVAVQRWIISLHEEIFKDKRNARVDFHSDLL